MGRRASGSYVYYHESVSGASDQTSIALNNDASEGAATSVSVFSQATQTGRSGKATAKGISAAALTTNADSLYVNATSVGATTYSYGLSDNSKLILNKQSGTQNVRINANTTFRVYDPAYGLSDSEIVATSGSRLTLDINATSKASDGAVAGSKAFGLENSKIESGAQADIISITARHRLSVNSNTSQALVNSEIKTGLGNDIVRLHTDQAYIYNQHSLYKSTIDLGGGDDAISLNSGFIGATIIGGDGFDVLETRGLTSQMADSLFKLKYIGNRKFNVDGHTLTGILDGIEVIKFDDLNYDLTSFYLKEKNWKGSSANDIYNASEKSDKINGGGGSDRLNGCKGNDLIKGDDGNDVIDGGMGNDTIEGGSGRDTAVFSSRNNRINLNITKWQNTGDGKDRLISIECVNAGGGNDVVTGNKAANTLNGQNGNDILYGQLGNDVIHGGAGRDTAVFSGRKNRINLNITKWQTTGDGKDRLISIECVNAGGGNDVVTGNKAANTLNGQKGNDQLKGGAGNDRLIGGQGFDKLWGQAGRDTFVLTKGSGYDRIMDFKDGVDRIQLGKGLSNLNVQTRNGHAFVYEGKDLMAVVIGAADALQGKDNFLV